MLKIAVLSNGYLIGVKQTEVLAAEDVAVDDNIDLPLDGSYRWDSREQCFVPRGHGHCKPISCPVPEPLVMYYLAKATVDAPQEVRNWQNWYEENLLERHEEQSRNASIKRSHK